MSYEHILLRNRADIVGFGKYVLDPRTCKPTEVIHGYALRQFAKPRESLVGIHGVQIFEEFEEQPYPYKYRGFEQPPALLGDLNKFEKAFKQIIAWDNNRIIRNPRPELTKLCALPRKVSIALIDPLRNVLACSPVKVRFEESERPSLIANRAHKRRKVASSDSFTYRSVVSELMNVGPDDSRTSRSGQAGLDVLQDGVDVESVSSSQYEESVDQFQEEYEEEQRKLQGVSEIRENGTEKMTSAFRKEERRITGCSSRRRIVLEEKYLSPSERICQKLFGNSCESRSEERDATPQRSHQQPSRRDSLGSGGRKRHASAQRNEMYHALADVTEAVDDDTIQYPETAYHAATEDMINRFQTMGLGRDTNAFCGTSALCASQQSIPIPSNLKLPFSMSIKKRAYRCKTRKKAALNEVSKLRRKRTKQWTESFTNNPFCNPRKCCNAGCFLLVNPEYAVIQYRKFLLMDRAERKRALTSMYIRGARSFWFDGAYVCTRFLAKGLTFSNQLQCAVKGTLKARASSSIMPCPRENTKETKKNQIIIYLNDLANRIGDSLPTKPHRNLPLMSKKEVLKRFRKYNNDLDARDDPSSSYFYNVWRKFCMDIKTHRHHGFTVCDTCERIRMAFEVTENEQTEALVRKEMEVHYQFLETERRDYERRRDLARRNPTKYLSLIVDGADQKSYGLPHFVFSTKEDKGQKLKMKIIGVLEHGCTKQLSLFTLTEEFESGANHIIEAVHRVLNRTKSKRRRLPPVLFIQADNCTRENKNTFFLSYLEMLVKKGVFQEVHLSFLPIGHTHADIDQAFSSVAVRFKLESDYRP